MRAHTSACGGKLDWASAVGSDSKGFVDSSNGLDGDIGVIAGVMETYPHQATNTHLINAQLNGVCVNNYITSQKTADAY